MYDVKLLNKAAARLIANRQTVSVAESVTAGLIQNAFSKADGAVSFFEGGITAYTISQKCTHLFIDPAHAISCNCVSQRVAEEMAMGVSNSFQTDWGLSITGYFSVIPELGIDKLHAWYALSFAGKIILSDILYSRKKEPGIVQEDYRDSIIDLVAGHWNNLPLLSSGG